ncbi:MAG: hypothetical protein ABJK37_17085 [Paraglaciecola sp.]|uniref:hypothetical protein n=1 Tax=Paraglaciecola sp. TaxID=1920173 RepID=UPI00329A5226
METSDFQALKLHMVELLGLSKDAIHVHIGMSVFILSVVVLAKGKVTFKCLIPVCIVALGLEVMDLIDDFNSVGFFRWSNSLHDFINTLLWPLVIVVLNKKLKKHQSSHTI